MKYTSGESDCGYCNEANCKSRGGVGCIDCVAGGQKCVEENAYSVLGGVVTPKNSAYTFSGMSNPNTERPVKRLNDQIPSLTDLGGQGTMKSFNPYNSLGTYRNNVNFTQNNSNIPKAYGGSFVTNVNLDQPNGSPILARKGINTGGYLPPDTGKALVWCGRKKCKRPRGFFRSTEKAQCLKYGVGRDAYCKCTFGNGDSMGCGSSAMVEFPTNNFGF